MLHKGKKKYLLTITHDVEKEHIVAFTDEQASQVYLCIFISMCLSYIPNREASQNKTLTLVELEM